MAHFIEFCTLSQMSSKIGHHSRRPSVLKTKVVKKCPKHKNCPFENQNLKKNEDVGNHRAKHWFETLDFQSNVSTAKNVSVILKMICVLKN